MNFYLQLCFSGTRTANLSFHLCRYVAIYNPLFSGHTHQYDVAPETLQSDGRQKEHKSLARLELYRMDLEILLDISSSDNVIQRF